MSDDGPKKSVLDERSTTSCHGLNITNRNMLFLLDQRSFQKKNRPNLVDQFDQVDEFWKPEKFASKPWLL